MGMSTFDDSFSSNRGNFIVFAGLQEELSQPGARSTTQYQGNFFRSWGLVFLRNLSSDGNSALILVCDRLRHVIRYLDSVYTRLTEEIKWKHLRKAEEKRNGCFLSST